MKPTADGLYNSGGDPEGDSTQPQHYNSPGKTTLSYRVGTRATSLNRMLARLHAQTSSQGNRPLAALNREQRDDAAIALLDAWATVVDVLSFYQERIANEGYLRTATEDFSVLELTRPLGYKLSPGVAASTFLAFTVEDTPSSPGVVTVPEGTRVQSIPGQGQLPQTFETLEKIEAKAEWNVLKRYNSWIKESQKVYWNTTELNVKGINTQLQPGDNILLIDEEAQQPNQFGCFTLQTVELYPQEGYTRITWQHETEQLLNEILTFLARFLLQISINKSQNLPSTHEDKSLRVSKTLLYFRLLRFYLNIQLEKPRIFAFRQRVALFGHNAPDWNEMSEEVKRKYSPDLGGIFCFSNKDRQWKSIYGAVKNADIRALVTFNKSIFAGTHNGIFRSNDEGKQWMPINKGLTNTDIHSLIVNDKGHLFAGATGGNVFRSTNGGDIWVAIGTGSVTIIEHRIFPLTEQQVTQEFKKITDNLSNVSDRDKILKIVDEAKDVIIKNANKDKEIWIPLNTSLPNTVVYSLITYQYQTTNGSQNLTVDYIFAGTDKGLFCSQDNGGSWTSFNPNSVLTDKVIYSLTHYYHDSKTHYIFVGTDKGMFCLQDNGGSWTSFNPNSVLTDKVIYSLTHYYHDSKTHYIFVGTKQGLFYSQDDGKSCTPWTQCNINPILKDKAIYLLIHYKKETKNYIFVGTDQGLFYSQDDGTNWTEVDDTSNHSPEAPGTTTNMKGKAIRCLTVNSNEDILAGTTFTGLDATEWPGFTIQDSYIIDLDANYTKVLADSWVVLMNQSDKQPYKVKSVATVSRNDFLQNAKLTRLEFEKKENLSLFGGQRLRETIVLTQSEPLELFENLVQENSPVKGDEIELEQLVQGLEGKKIIVSGKLMRARFKGTEGSLTSLDCSQSVKLKDNELLVAIAPPTKEANQTTEIWYLKNKLGFSGIALRAYVRTIFEGSIHTFSHSFKFTKPLSHPCF